MHKIRLMKNILLISFCLILNYSTYSQDSPYKTDIWKDGAYIAGTVGFNVLGFTFIQNKDALTEAEVAALDKNDIWGIDRWAAGYSSEKADAFSYIPFYTALAAPLFFCPVKQKEITLVK